MGLFQKSPNLMVHLLIILCHSKFIYNMFFIHTEYHMLGQDRGWEKFHCIKMNLFHQNYGFFSQCRCTNIYSSIHTHFYQILLGHTKFKSLHQCLVMAHTIFDIVTLNSQKTSHSLPLWASYGVSIVSICRKSGYVIVIGSCYTNTSG